MVLELAELQGTPVFTAEGRAPELGRVYGATYHKERGHWFFPAYPPFGLLVLRSLAEVVPRIELGEGVAEHIAYLESVPGKVERREIPAIDYVTKPFDHQLEGEAFLYHYPRAALYWDAGTGKSKVIVDLLLLLGKPKAREITIESLWPHGGTRIQMLGTDKPLKWVRKGNDLSLRLPEQLPGDYAYALKLTPKPSK